MCICFAAVLWQCIAMEVRKLDPVAMAKAAALRRQHLPQEAE